jgi:[ribosomal protein S5]-alanine N-acetyltransferase
MSALETERLLLRPVEESDFEDLCELYADPDVMRYLARGHPLTRDETRERLDRMLAHWQDHGYGIWSVFHRADGEYVGRCGIVTTHALGAPEVAYTFYRRFWGRGLATEACRRVVEHGFEVLLLPRLLGVARVENVGSQRVMVKLGMASRKNFEYEGFEAVLYELNNPLLSSEE